MRLSYFSAVRRMPLAAKLAISSFTLWVEGRMLSLAPPMMPARPTGPSASAITRSSEVSDSAFSLSSVSVSPSLARRTVMGPCTRSQS